MSQSIMAGAGGARRAAAAVATALALTALAAPAQAAETVLAETGPRVSGSALYMAGPSRSAYPPHEPLPGRALSDTIVPSVSGTPTRLDLGMARGDDTSSPVRLALYEAEPDGRPSDLLVAVTLDADVFPSQGQYDPLTTLTEVPIVGWPRLEAGKRYALGVWPTTDQTTIGWFIARPTATVPSIFYGRVFEEEPEPSWHTPDSYWTLVLRVVQEARATQLTAHGLIADLGPRRLNLTVSATLMTADPRTPVAGKEIRFYTGNQLLCTAITGAGGRAACGVPQPLVSTVRQGGGYRASFAGDSAYGPSSGQGALVK